MASHWWNRDNEIVWDRCEECDEDEVEAGHCRACGAQQTIPPESTRSPDGPADAIESLRADLREILSA